MTDIRQKMLLNNSDDVFEKLLRNLLKTLYEF